MKILTLIKIKYEIIISNLVFKEGYAIKRIFLVFISIFIKKILNLGDFYN